MKILQVVAIFVVIVIALTAFGVYELTQYNGEVGVANTLSNQVTSLNGQVSSQNTQILGLTSQKQALQTQLSATQTNLTSVTNQRNAVQTKLTATQNNLAATQNNLTATILQRNSLQSKLSAANANISQLKGQINTLNGQIATLNSQVTTLTSQITTLQAQITSDIAQIASLQAQISQLQSTITDLTNRVNMKDSTSLLTNQAFSITASSTQYCSYSEVYTYTATFAGYLSISATSNSQYTILAVAYGSSAYGSTPSYYRTVVGTTGTFNVPMAPGQVHVTILNCDIVTVSGSVSIIEYT